MYPTERKMKYFLKINKCLLVNFNVIYWGNYIAELCWLSLCLNFFPPTCLKDKLGGNFFCLNKFFHNFDMCESRFTCVGLRASGLVQRLLIEHTSNCIIYSSTCWKWSVFRNNTYFFLSTNSSNMAVYNVMWNRLR